MSKKCNAPTKSCGWQPGDNTCEGCGAWYDPSPSPAKADKWKCIRTDGSCVTIPNKYACTLNGKPCEYSNMREPSQPEPMPLISSPQNPYPEDIFTFTIEDYVKAIPDEHLRTGISGAVGRYVFNLCCEDWQKLIAEWLPTHDHQVRKAARAEFAEECIKDLQLESDTLSSPSKRREIDYCIAQIRAMAEKE